MIIFSKQLLLAVKAVPQPDGAILAGPNSLLMASEGEFLSYKLRGEKI